MGFFERFRSTRDRIGEDKKPKHAVRGDDAKKQEQAEKDELKKQFQAVPSGKPEKAPSETPAKDAKAAPAKQPKKGPSETGDAFRVLIRPIISEKGTILAEINQYVFEVATNVNKVQVRDAVRRVYNVTPTAVRMMNVRGKHVRHGRTEGTTKSWKKAIVTLKQGDRIDLTQGA